ncbi:PQQ-binding-like beta-propeller repeat protein [bacterium]|nr:PQQ-binding-like beta-propeller repeat protein [bacterium]
MKKLGAFIVVFSFLTLNLQLLADWSQFHYDFRNTGKTEDAGPQNGELDWQLSLNFYVSPYGGPSIGSFNGQKTIFLGTNSGIYLISPQGVIIDSILTLDSVKTVIAIKNEMIYFGCGDSLKAYSPAGLYWSCEIGDDISHVSIFGNIIYVCGGDKLWNFNLDGSLNWNTDVLGGGIYNSAPAIDQFGNIYVATLGNAWQWYDFKIYAFNPDGTERWVNSFLVVEPGGVRVTPTIDENGNIYVATYWEDVWGSSVISIDANGEQNWRREDDDVIYSSLAFSDDCLYYGNRQGITARSFNGDFLWEFSNLGQVSYSSSAIGSNNTVYIGTDEGFFIALNNQGELQWSYDTQEGYLNSSAIDSNRVYVASHQSLFAFREALTSTKETINELKCLQIYPNPFNSKIAISFQLLVNSEVNLSIYNVKGQKVKTFINDQFDIGQHSILWNGKDENNQKVVSGIYFCMLRIGKSTETRKVVFLK